MDGEVYLVLMLPLNTGQRLSACAFLVLCTVGCIALIYFPAELDRPAPLMETKLCELRRDKVAAPWIMKLLLCWRAVAKAANISWVLASGTLLAAVRDGKVIPWDGDGDCMISSTAEWARVYSLYMRDPRKLEAFARSSLNVRTCHMQTSAFPHTSQTLGSKR